MNARIFPAVATWIGLLSGTARAEYHGFDKAEDVQATVQDVRWPFWAESTYNAIYSQTIRGEKGVSVYFYGGGPLPRPGGPPKRSPAKIILGLLPPAGVPGGSVRQSGVSRERQPSEHHLELLAARRDSGSLCETGFHRP